MAMEMLRGDPVVRPVFFSNDGVEVTDDTGGTIEGENDTSLEIWTKDKR